MKSNVLPCDNDQRLCVTQIVRQQNFEASCWNWFLNWIHVREVNIGSRSILLLNTEFYQQGIHMSSIYFSGNLSLQMHELIACLGKTRRKRKRGKEKKNTIVLGTYIAFSKRFRCTKNKYWQPTSLIFLAKKNNQHLSHTGIIPHIRTQSIIISHYTLIYMYLNPRVNGLQFQEYQLYKLHKKEN